MVSGSSPKAFSTGRGSTGKSDKILRSTSYDMRKQVPVDTLIPGSAEGEDDREVANFSAQFAFANLSVSDIPSSFPLTDDFNDTTEGAFSVILVKSISIRRNSALRCLRGNVESAMCDLSKTCTSWQTLSFSASTWLSISARRARRSRIDC